MKTLLAIALIGLSVTLAFAQVTPQVIVRTNYYAVRAQLGDEFSDWSNEIMAVNTNPVVSFAWSNSPTAGCSNVLGMGFQSGHYIYTLNVGTANMAGWPPAKPTPIHGLTFRGQMFLSFTGAPPEPPTYYRAAISTNLAGVVDIQDATNLAGPWRSGFALLMTTGEDNVIRTSLGVGAATPYQQTGL